MVDDDNDIRFRNKQTGRTARLFGGGISWIVFHWDGNQANHNRIKIFNLNDKKEALAFARSFVDD